MEGGGYTFNALTLFLVFFMLICCLFVFGIDTSLKLVELVLGIIAFMFGFVHRFLATVFLFFKRRDHNLKIIR